jgi:predicted glycoside hydrolase/deacetylase ChbG (UPF0249 family)
LRKKRDWLRVPKNGDWLGSSPRFIWGCDVPVPIFPLLVLLCSCALVLFFSCLSPFFRAIARIEPLDLPPLLGVNSKTMEKLLIINADDFGFSPGVNKGIIQAHTKGVLTSATIMANMPAAEEAAELAKKTPTLGIGVHLNLTNGKPLCKDKIVGCLLDAAGDFTLKPQSLALLSLISGKIRAAIEAELSAQIQSVIDSGLKPTHLDSHKHIHSFPTIFPIVCRLAKQFAIPAIRFTFEPKQLCRPPWPFTDRQSRNRVALVRSMAKINLWQNKTCFKSQALLGVAHTGNINIDFFRAVSLYNNAAIAEVMTHPGYSYDLDAGKTRLVKQRQIELEALCSEKTKQYFKDAGTKLVHYGQL